MTQLCLDGTSLGKGCCRKLEMEYATTQNWREVAGENSSREEDLQAMEYDENEFHVIGVNGLIGEKANGICS